MAQKEDSIPAKPLIEKGAQGDILIGKENQKSQLSAAPQMLNTNAACKKDVGAKKKKAKHKRSAK